MNENLAKIIDDVLQQAYEARRLLYAEQTDESARVLVELTDYLVEQVGSTFRGPAGTEGSSSQSH